MTKIAALEAQAMNLQVALDAQGIKLPISHVQQALAGQYGLPSWDMLLVGAASQPAPTTRDPVLADLPGEPSVVCLERGPRSDYCEVNTCVWELLELLHLPEELDAYLADNEISFPDGLDSQVFELWGDGFVLEFSARQLMAGHYKAIAGKGHWYLPEEDAYLSFPSVSSWEAPGVEGVQQPLQVPEVVQTAKGVRLLKLTSDRAPERYVLIPPSVNPERIKGLVGEALATLATQDGGAAGDSSQSASLLDPVVAAVVADHGCVLLSASEVTALACH